MPELFGTAYPRAGLLRRVGRLEQVAGVRLVTLGDGLGRGVRVLEFRTGTGFAFEVLVDRCFDVGRCEFAGQPLSWLSAPGSSPLVLRAGRVGLVPRLGRRHGRDLRPGPHPGAGRRHRRALRPAAHPAGGVTGCTAGPAACPPGWPGTASAGTATSACCGRRVRCSSPRCSPSSSCCGGGSRPGSASPGSPSTTRSRTPGTRGPRTCSSTTATRASRCSTRAPSWSSQPPDQHRLRRSGRRVPDHAGPGPGATEACFEHELIAEPAGTVPWDC